LRRVRSGTRPAGAAWEELVASAVDLGVAADARGTPRSLAAAVSGRPAFESDAAASALITLRDAVERERYGPDRPVDDADDGDREASARRLVDALDAARAALHADAPAAERARATFLPRSLLPSGRSAIGRRPASGA
jgi:hypothetical protein